MTGVHDRVKHHLFTSKCEGKKPSNPISQVNTLYSSEYRNWKKSEVWRWGKKSHTHALCILYYQNHNLYGHSLILFHLSLPFTITLIQNLSTDKPTPCKAEKTAFIKSSSKQAKTTSTCHFHCSHTINLTFTKINSWLPWLISQEVF